MCMPLEFYLNQESTVADAFTRQLEDCRQRQLLHLELQLHVSTRAAIKRVFDSAHCLHAQHVQKNRSFCETAKDQKQGGRSFSSQSSSISTIAKKVAPFFVKEREKGDQQKE